MNTKFISITRRYCQFFLLGIVLLLPLCGSLQANAQGFMVKPMVIEFNPRAGQTVECVIELSNMQDNQDALEIIPWRSPNRHMAWYSRCFPRRLTPLPLPLHSSHIHASIGCRWINRRWISRL